MKLHVEAADCVCCPDVFIHRGSGIASAEKVMRDATLVVEVLSGSTAGVDRCEKLLACRKLPSLRAYWLVSQDEQRFATARDGVSIAGALAGDGVGGELFAEAMIDRAQPGCRDARARACARGRDAVGALIPAHPRVPLRGARLRCGSRTS